MHLMYHAACDVLCVIPGFKSWYCVGRRKNTEEKRESWRLAGLLWVSLNLTLTLLGWQDYCECDEERELRKKMLEQARKGQFRLWLSLAKDRNYPNKLINHGSQHREHRMALSYMRALHWIWWRQWTMSVCIPCLDQDVSLQRLMYSVCHVCHAHSMLACHVQYISYVSYCYVGQKTSS